MKEYRYSLTTMWNDGMVKVENYHGLATALNAIPIYHTTDKLVEATIHDFELDIDILTYIEPAAI